MTHDRPCRECVSFTFNPRVGGAWCEYHSRRTEPDKHVTYGIPPAAWPPLCFVAKDPPARIDARQRWVDETQLFQRIAGVPVTPSEILGGEWDSSRRRGRPVS